MNIYIAIYDIHNDNNTIDIEFTDDIEDILNTLEDFKKQCYKPLTNVFTFSPNAKLIDFTSAST